MAIKPNSNMKMSGLHLVEFELTHKCDQHCQHCYLGDFSRGREIVDMELEIAHKTLDQCYSLGVRHLVITGGAPSLHKNWRNIMEYAIEYNFLIQFETTGANLREDDFSLLGAKNVYVHLSIDAPPGRNSVLRPPEFNFNIVRLGRELQANGCKPYFFCTLHKKNLKYMDELIELSQNVGIPLEFNVLSCVGRAESLNTNMFFSKLETLNLCRKLIEKEKKGVIRRNNTIYFCLLDPNIQVIAKKSKRPIIGGCMAGIAQLDITPSGNVLPCPHLRIPVGNLHDESLSDIWFNAKLLNELRDRDNLSGDCKDCEYRNICGGCRGWAYKATGDVFAQDPTCFKDFVFNISR
jgi:radical SAM protein with 4Fe4S-binding SPASM domain